MRSYRVELSHQAQRMLDRIYRREPGLYKRVAKVLDDLEVNPFQGKPLKGQLKGRYSYRVGSYRIIYRIERHVLIVYVIDMGHRREIYR